MMRTGRMCGCNLCFIAVCLEHLTSRPAGKSPAPARTPNTALPVDRARLRKTVSAGAVTVADGITASRICHQRLNWATPAHHRRQWRTLPQNGEVCAAFCVRRNTTHAPIMRAEKCVDKLAAWLLVNHQFPCRNFHGVCASQSAHLWHI